jgi:hypothetical protein
MIVNLNESVYSGDIEAGLRLASLPESEGGWAEYFDPDLGLELKDDYMRATTALALENNKRWQARICKGKIVEGKLVVNEATRAALIGGYSDMLFPVIRAAVPSNPINDLVSLQPTTKRVATVVYWHWIYGSTKGSVVKGQRVFDANTGVTSSQQNYSGEFISNETVAVTLSNDGGTGDVAAGTLAYHDGGGVRPGSVQISITGTIVSGGTAVTIVLNDNGNGTLIARDTTTPAAITLDAGTINYTTGAFSANLPHATYVFRSGVTSGTASYRWNSEGSTSIPEVDIQIVTSTVETQRRAMKLNYSVESMQDAMAEWGVSLEPNLVSTAAELINMETAYQLISEMWNAATLMGTWDVTIPDGISVEQHFRSLVYTINKASNLIWQQTQKGYGNWIVVDTPAASIIESLPRDLFERAPRPASTHGLHLIGTLAGSIRVYKYLFLANETGASTYPNGNILMGYKGNNFFDAGLVYSLYQAFYTTDALTTADFVTQKGMASRYATKMVNPFMYVRIGFTAT